MPTPEYRITVIFNNIRAVEPLDTAWGFACLVEGLDRTLLFDTGSDGRMLLANMKRLAVDPATIDGAFLSHLHGDHTGGLEQFLRLNPKVKVYFPRSFPQSLQQGIQLLEADITAIEGPAKLCHRVHSTGEMGTSSKEQTLILETCKGLVIITGCAHPGVVDMAKKASRHLGKDVYLIMGGFHLMGEAPPEIERCIKVLKALGVKKVARSHCTGERPSTAFAGSGVTASFQADAAQ